MIALWLVATALGGPVADGAAAFDDGRLDDAIAAWEAGAEGGSASGVLRFDLGNAWYRKGDLPRAIAHFRGAQRLRPRDGDVHHNLALARSELGPVPPPVGSEPVWTTVVTPAELSIVGMLVTVVGSALLVWARVRRRGRLAAVGTWGLGLAVLALALSGASSQADHPLAVVVEADAVARDAADASAGERHRLRPGTEVRVQRRYGGFWLVEDSLGRRGWVSEGAVLVL